MFGAIGIVVILVMVFGGYTIHGGKMGPIIAALPFEMIMIGGAAVGAFLVSNDLAAVKHTVKDMGKVFKGVIWKPADYRDLLKIADIDAIIVSATPETTHYAMAKDALLAGKHVAADGWCSAWVKKA